MSVGVGMGIGRGHVTLGHGVNLTSSNTTTSSASSDGMDGGEHDQISPTWSVQCWDTLGDQVDHLILLPERALTMDSGWLQADLAEILAHSVIGHGRGDARDYSVAPFLSHPHERSSSSHEGSDSWFPHSRRRSLDWSLVNSSSGQPQSPFVAIATSSDRQESCSATAAAAAAAAAASAVQREERSKVLRERQNEERQRKLEELKQQALATQKFREQQEEERRRRMEEQRLRDLERRTQVEERKKAILEAERERREAMLRRSEDRGIRQETKRRNERGSIAFAFGSSTPRMLEPVDSCSSYWGSRRATSTTNVMSASSHGRVTLNEATTPNGGGNNNKLRASSVFGLDQNQGDDLMTQSTSAVQGGRRKRTDLIPTIPIHRGEGDRSPRSPLYGSSSGASSSRGSVNRSTGMSVSMSRLDQLSQPRRRLSQNQLPSPSTPLQPLHETETQQQPPTASTQNKTASNSSTTRSSRPTSRTHQTSSSTTTTASSPSSPQGTIAARGNRSMSKSMSHLAPGRPSPSSAKASTPIDGSTPPTPTRHGGATTTTRAERLRQKARQHASQRPQHGLRSGDITPSSPTRPLSALSQVSSVSTTVASSSTSVSGYHVRARTAPAGGRKPRPVSIAGTGMSLSEAARTSRASRENINSRERSKETKEKENERTRQTQPTPATTPRPARARSADMRKDNNNATHKSSPEGAPSQPSNAKRPIRDAGKHPSSARDAKTPVKATAEAPKSAKGVKTEEGAAPTLSSKTNNKSVAVTKKADEDALKVELPQVQVTVPAADSHQQESKEVVNVKVEEEETYDTTAAVETLPATETEMISMTDSTASGDAPDVEVPPLVTSANNDVATTPTEASNAEGQVSVESIPSGTTTPSETGSVSGDSIPSSLTSRKIISSEEEAKAALAEKRRLAREQMEREAERERLRAEEERLVEEERLRQEELEQKLAEEEMDRMALEARQAEEERLQKAIEETQRREEEERLRREEEVRQRVEKEQQDRKAREEAEKLRKENEERLRREEEERQERRKRVEAIMARTRGKSSGPGSSNNKSGNELNNTVSSGQSASDVTSVGMMNNSISQPDLLGDIVNKTTSNGSGGGNSNGQSSLSPDDDSLMDDDTTKKNNGFHHNHHHNQHIDATDSSSSLASTTSDLPDISNVTANADTDSVNSIASTNNITAEVEHVEFLA